jgi:hypothetical protein
MVLIAVLLILLAVTGSSSSFVWLMNQQQTRAGQHLRAVAALRAAEAGVHRALSILETVAPDRQSPGRTWRAAGYAEEIGVGPLRGRFTLALADESDGAVIVSSEGEVAGATRRVRARVYLASPALLAALYGASVVRLEKPPAVTFILPYGAGIGDRPWIHIAAGREIWFATSYVSINSPTVAFGAGAGPVDTPADAGGATAVTRPGPVRLLLARGAELTLDESRQPVDIQQLRAMGVYVEGVVLRADALPRLPEVDRTFYQTLAAGNRRNAHVNEAAGRYLGDGALERKRDSLYTRDEFERLLSFFRSGLLPSRLEGVIYVKGVVELSVGQRLEIAEGALVTESGVHLNQAATLEITHSPATRTLPGLLVTGTIGSLIVTEGARLRVHGLVYATRAFDVREGARVDIVGAVLNSDAELSFRNLAATVVIRYDPAVLGTPGLRIPDDAPVVAWVAAWEELR